MGIIKIEPKKGGISDHSADVDGRSYTVEVTAVVDDIATGPMAIRSFLASQGYVAGAAYKWPLGTPTETDPGAGLQSIRIRHDDDSGIRYAVTLSYGSRVVTDNGPAQGAGVANWIMAPWMARPSIRWGSTEREISCHRDRNGDPILNKANQPFDPPLTVPESVLTATVARVEQAFSPGVIQQYKDHLNAAAWHGWPPESVRCLSIEAEPFDDADWGTMHRVTYVFGFRPAIVVGADKIFPGWGVPVLNAGKMQLVGTKLVKIYDADMQPVSEPVPLRADGTWDIASEPVYIVFDMYPTADFDAFNFPANLFGPPPP